MKLIDGHAMIQRVEALHKRGAVDLSYFNIVKEAVQMEPAVDAAPVVRSRWKQTDAYPHWLYCLNCYKRIVPNVEWIEEYSIPTNYCPNCGAKMDLQTDH